MANSKCCFGCSNVRKCSLIIAIFDMFLCLILMIQTLSTLKFVPYKKSYSNNGYRDDVINYNSHYEQHQYCEIDFDIFCRLFILFLFFYVNLNLKKATSIHNTQSINQWLVTNSIFFVFFVLFIGFFTMKSSSSILIPIGIPISIVVVYQIYVVKTYYDDELKFLATSDRNVITQSSMHNPPYVTISSQAVQAPVYPAQPIPYVIHQIHQPATQAPYPQQTYQYQPQQQPAPSHTLPTDTFTPQEYCNPPPYSPSFLPESSSSSVKQ